jgi:hypothetical protein
MGEEIRATKPRSRSKASTAYLYSWGVVAVCGMAYVGVAATRPDLIGSVLPLADQTNDQTFAGRAVADVADELATLRKWVNDMQHELATTRSAMQEQASQQAALVQRLSAAEERLPATREIRADGTAKALAPRVSRAAQILQPAQQQQGVAAAAVRPPAEPAAPPAQVADVSNVRVINPVASSPITTGSVAQPPSGGAAAPKTPTVGGPRGIEIAAADSLDGLRSKWGDLAGRNTDALGELAPRYRLATDGRQSPFTLVAGPFSTPADAARTCAQLKARGIVCRVSDFSGSAF